MISDSPIPVLTLIAPGASLTVSCVSTAVAVALTDTIIKAEAIIDSRNFIVHNLLDDNNG